MVFKWRDSFSCNIREIDKQHKNLFEIGGRLFSIASLKDDYDHYDEIMSILNELKAYTVYHFSYEEKLLEEYNFPEKHSHKTEHIFFIKKLERLEKSDLEGNQSKSLIKLVEFVADWISSHILKTDMQYKEFLNSKGVY